MLFEKPLSISNEVKNDGFHERISEREGLERKWDLDRF
jgi:hypothetical protein